MDYAVPTEQRITIKESEMRDTYLDLARESQKAKVHDVTSGNNCNWYARNEPQRLGKGTWRCRNQKTNRDRPDYNIMIGQYI